MSKFILFLHEQPTNWTGLSPAEMQSVIEEYRAWAGRLAAAGRLLGGEKLVDEGGRRMAMRDGSLVVTDGPYAEAKDVIGGYFLIEAADYAEAERLCADSPHLKYGTIEVRRVDKLA